MVKGKLMFILISILLILLAIALFAFESWHQIKDLAKDYGENEQ